MTRIRLYLLMLVASIAFANVATAQTFTGIYNFTRHATCIDTSGGFTSEFTPSNGTAYSSSFSVNGVRTYNGNGTGTVQATVVGNNDSQSPSASSSTISYDFTYSVASNGTITSQVVPGSFVGKVLTGPRAGQTFTNSGGTEGGHVSTITTYSPVFTLSPLAPIVETTTYSNGSVDYRICNGQEVLVYQGP